MVPASRLTHCQRRPIASDWRIPSARATDQRVPLRRFAAAARMQRASSRVSESISVSSPIGGSTRAATLTAILPLPCDFQGAGQDAVDLDDRVGLKALGGELGVERVEVLGLESVETVLAKVGDDPAADLGLVGAV